MTATRLALAHLVDAWRRPAALELWPRAMAGVRDWQQALAEAAPPRLTLDAWPREPDLAPLLAPMARSPLADWREAATDADTGAADEAQARRLGAPQPAMPPAGHAGAAGAPPVATAAHAGRLWPGASDAAASTHASSPGSSPVRATSPAAAARMAALLARHADLAAPSAAAATRPDPARRVPRLAATESSTLPASRADRGNVIALAPRRPLREPAQGPGSPTLARWREALAGPPGNTHRVAALLATGATAARQPAVGAAFTGTVRPDRRRPTATAPDIAPEAASRDSTFLLDGRPAVMPRAATVPAGTPLATTPEPLADLRAALSRIEQHLAAAPAPTPAPLATPAADAPQWLDDDEHLAERLHDILRRQARRHGIDAP